jgi:hypothetical protein
LIWIKPLLLLPLVKSFRISSGAPYQQLVERFLFLFSQMSGMSVNIGDHPSIAKAAPGSCVFLRRK